MEIPIWSTHAITQQQNLVYTVTVASREIGTGIFEASKTVSIFLHDVRGGKQVSSSSSSIFIGTQI